MSDEKRRSARTQSRFSCDKEAQSSRREKDKQKGLKKSSKSGEKAKTESQAVKTAADGITVEYQENSKYSFKEIDIKKKPEELGFCGVHELSKTENGVSRLIFDADFLLKEHADKLMDILINTTKWHDKNIVIRGEEFPQPRLVAWYGPFPYMYSGATLDAAEMPPTVVDIKQRVENFLKENGIEVNLNSVLLNLYRNEKDSVAWHSDDELTMGVYPTIASVSLGCTRKFEMRPKLHTIQQIEKFEEDYSCYVNLTSGSLIVMDGCMQNDWQHRVPKEYHDKQPRINLTFRTVYPVDQLSPQVPYSKAVNVKSINSEDSKSPKASEAFLGVEDFPPLMPDKQRNASHTKRKASNDIAPSSHEVSGHSHQDSDTESAVHENENQNNLNKDLDSYTLEDSSHYNLMEPEKSSGKSPIVVQKLVDEVSEESYTNNNLSPKENSAQRIEPVIDNSSQPEVPSSSNKYQFNINAPDFIPKGVNVVEPANTVSEPVYTSYNFAEIARFYYANEEMGSEEAMDILRVIFSKIDKYRQGHYFWARDWYELDTLHKLYNGGLNEANQLVVLDRICSIIQKYEFESSQRDNRSPHRYQGNRNGYSGDSYNRNRNYSRTYYRN